MGEKCHSYDCVLPFYNLFCFYLINKIQVQAIAIPQDTINVFQKHHKRNYNHNFPLLLLLLFQGSWLRQIDKHDSNAYFPVLSLFLHISFRCPSWRQSSSWLGIWEPGGLFPNGIWFLPSKHSESQWQRPMWWFQMFPPSPSGASAIHSCTRKQILYNDPEQ